MNVSVLGCGRWGSFIGWYLVNNGHNVIQWGTAGNYTFEVLKNTGGNEYVELDKRINLTSDLQFAIKNSDIIIISIRRITFIIIVITIFTIITHFPLGATAYFIVIVVHAVVLINFLFLIK